MYAHCVNCTTQFYSMLSISISRYDRLIISIAHDAVLSPVPTAHGFMKF